MPGGAERDRPNRTLTRCLRQGPRLEVADVVRTGAEGLVLVNCWLLTGAGGLLGEGLVPLLPRGETAVRSHNDLDITDTGAVVDAVAGRDVVVNLAAWTDADRAEAEQDAAMAVNARGAANVAWACRRHGARMVHISSDYVFDGTATEPYSEDAPVCPLSVYGRGKAEAEAAVRKYLPDSGIILRTAWLYGAHGKNFVSTMRQLAETRDYVEVVNDQTGQPTWARDLAERIVEVVERDVPAGIYHATNAGHTTWHGLAREVFAALGHDPERVRAVTSDEYRRKMEQRAPGRRVAPRPAYSVLSHDAWRRVGIDPMRPWREALYAALPVIFSDLRLGA